MTFKQVVFGKQDKYLSNTFFLCVYVFLLSQSKYR